MLNFPRTSRSTLKKFVILSFMSGLIFTGLGLYPSIANNYYGKSFFWKDCPPNPDFPDSKICPVEDSNIITFSFVLAFLCFAAFCKSFYMYRKGDYDRSSFIPGHGHGHGHGSGSGSGSGSGTNLGESTPLLNNPLLDKVVIVG